MSKWFEVVVKAYEVCSVEVKDEEDIEDAIEVALNDCSFSFSQNKEIDHIQELKTTEDIEFSKRHADFISGILP